MGHHVTIRAVKLRSHDEGLRCDRLRGIGYAWYCRCGKRGPIQGSMRAARAAGREHSAQTPTIGGMTT